MYLILYNTYIISNYILRRSQQLLYLLFIIIILERDARMSCDEIDYCFVNKVILI